MYVKWARIDGDSLAITTWQLVLAWIVITVFLPFFEGTLHIWPMHAAVMLSVLYIGVVGCGIAYILWFGAVGRLSATTSALGVLTSPAIGVLSSMMLLGERPTVGDLIGFGLIVAASACVLVSSGK